MKLKSLVFVGLLLLVSCANQDDRFKISALYAPGPLCGATSGTGVQSGYLDVAAGAPTFFVGATIEGADAIVQQDLSVGSTPLEAANRNKPIITSVVVTYELSKKIGATPKPYTQTIFLPFTGGTASAAVQIISPDLGDILFNGLTPVDNPADEFVDILARIEFKGEYSSDRAPFGTGQVTLPIRAYRSNPPTPCPLGYKKYPLDMTGGTNKVDACSYVGAQPNQYGYPAPPDKCCNSATDLGC